MTKHAHDLDTLDAIYDELAMFEAEHGTSTPQQKQIAQRVKTRVEARLAELRRNLLPAADPPMRLRPIRPSLLALGRDALLAMLEELRRTRAVQYAHCNLQGLSDDDLRRLIELLEE
jgi:hypothetical protein